MPFRWSGSSPSSTVTTRTRTSILESPWYWIYSFTAVGLALLLLIGPKFAQRQANQEKQHQARQRAIQIEQGKTPTVEPSSVDNRRVQLKPLFIVLIVLMLVAWIVTWYTHFYRRPATSSASPEADHEKEVP